MRTRITKLAVLQTGKLLALFSGLLSVVMYLFNLSGFISNPSIRRFAFMVFMLISGPVIGFVYGIAIAFFYNLFAKWFGGIVVTLEAIEKE